MYTAQYINFGYTKNSILLYYGENLYGIKEDFYINSLSLMNPFLVTGIAKKVWLLWSRHQLGSSSCYNKYQTNKESAKQCYNWLILVLPGRLHAVKFIIKHSLCGKTTYKTSKYGICKVLICISFSKTTKCFH